MRNRIRSAASSSKEGMMRGQLILSAFAICTLVADKGETDRDKIQGAWQIESLQENGKAAPDEKAITEVVIKEDKIIFKYAKLKHEAINTFHLDGSKKPKCVDVTFPGRKEPYQGIYQLEGDTLKMCWTTNPDRERPNAFATEEKSGRRLMILKRKK
jgi:uncharacterized protein (TIGR03067 family)